MIFPASIMILLSSHSLSVRSVARNEGSPERSSGRCKTCVTYNLYVDLNFLTFYLMDNSQIFLLAADKQSKAR